MTRFFTALCTITLLLLFFSTAKASPRQEILLGPIPVEVLRVLDGDTISVKARVWIGSDVETSVRIEGIDAPEIKGKCEKERSMAEAARQEVARLLGGGNVSIYNIRLEKYAGRVMAQIQTADGINIGKHMVEKGFARPYHGDKRKPWCRG